MSLSTAVESLLGRHAREARSLRSPQPVRLSEPPTALEFARLVHMNAPVIIEHVADSWPAMSNWKSRDYLARKMKGQEVVVAVTPNGLADAVVDNRFVLPYEQRLPFQELLEKFSEPRGAPPPAAWKSGTTTGAPPVYYVQSQNNNMHSEQFAPLLDDIPSDLGFASEALGKQPDAVNIWIGSAGASTSVHKDHYENLYLVVAGVKTFVLIPPTESFCLYEKPYPTAQYTPSTPDPTHSTIWTIEDCIPAATTPWASVDPLHESLNPHDADAQSHPLFAKYCRPLVVTVRAGEMLYLPSMWHHQVLQEEEVMEKGFGAAIAVNYWYDMEYGNGFCAAGLNARLGRMVAGVEEWDREEVGSDGEDGV
ncbi:jmjC domain-containing protein 7 [Powellomyces hirtus]|nr:jmjC domain-containing protein 7 [Powellomyces hirtus]